jgi:hypothetical protein
MNIYEQAINKFGADHQILKSVSELNELSLALMHYREGKATVEQVQIEMVDVHIMLKQLNIIIGEPSEELVAKQLNKLNKAINS